MCACMYVVCQSFCLFFYVCESACIFIYLPVCLVYEGAPSDVHITPAGCYKEDAANPAMQVTFYNEFGPEMPNFAKRLLPQSSKDYKDKFPAFLLKCARKAKENKWEYFAVREHGEKFKKQIISNKKYSFK